LAAIVSETADTRPQKMSISSSKAEARQTRSADDYQASVVQAVHAREQIRILQLRLRDAGFDAGQVDGLMGPKTKSALAQYEASRAGEKTKASLSNPSVRGQYWAVFRFTYQLRLLCIRVSNPSGTCKF
jgi:hypothetical protein